MTEETSQVEQKRSRRAALAAVAVLAAFALVFIGLVLFLDHSAEKGRSGEASIASISETEPFYVLLIGSDSRKGTALYTGKAGEHAQLEQHSDVMTLVRIDPETYAITLVTVPRDTVLEGSSSKINDSLLGNNPESVVDTVEELTGVEINYYMMTTFSLFESLVNALGGVTVDVPKDIMVPDPMTAENVSLTAGENQSLDGSETLVLARARKEYGDNQDALRQINVRNIEMAMIQKVLSSSNEQEVNDTLLDLEENTVTNLDVADMGYLVVDFIVNREKVTIYSCTGPYAGGKNAEGTWVVQHDPAAWVDIMAVVDAGEDPAGVAKAPTFD